MSLIAINSQCNLDNLTPSSVELFKHYVKVRVFFTRDALNFDEKKSHKKISFPYVRCVGAV